MSMPPQDGSKMPGKFESALRSSRTRCMSHRTALQEFILQSMNWTTHLNVWRGPSRSATVSWPTSKSSRSSTVFVQTHATLTCFEEWASPSHHKDKDQSY